MNRAEQAFKVMGEAFANLKGIKDTTTEDKFCPYDGYNDDFIIEHKWRKSKYDGNTLIEKQKYDRNINEGRRFIYAITVGNELYLFDLTAKTAEDYDFGWKVEKGKHPATTSFSRRERVDKETGYINFDQAKFVICLSTSRVIWRN